MSERERPSGMSGQNEVLIAIDGSLSSQVAATLASQIAEYQHMNIKGLYVVNEHYLYNNYTDIQPEIGPINPPPTRSELADLFRLRGEMALDWLNTLCRSLNVPFRAEIVYGQVADEIAQRAKCATFASFGKKGFHHPDDWSHLGENFHQFVHQIHVPFIAGDQELRSIGTILLGYNGSQTSNQALQWAKIIAEAFQAKTYVVYVRGNDDPVENAQRLAEAVRESQLENYEWILCDGDPAVQLAKAAVQYNANLLVIGCYHPSIMNRLKGSTMDRLLQQVRLTTLVS